MMGKGSIEELNGFLAHHEKVAKPKILAIGSTVGNWRIEAFLGSGGNAEVYRVTTDDGGHRQAALKILSRDDQSARLRFFQEKDILSKHPSPFLEKYIDDGETSDRPYIVTELLEPVDLPSTDVAVAEYLLNICSALSSLHKNELVHRDLKPSNIMRRTDGTLVLIDLGLVKDIAKSAEPQKDVSIIEGRIVAVGTPAYAAPEQMNGGEISAAADIHALGRIADAAFEGRPPRHWLPVIRRATSSIPSQRYASVEELAHAIRARKLRGRLTKIVAAALFAAATAAIGWWYWDSIGREARQWSRLCEKTPTNIVVRLSGTTNVFTRPLILKPSLHYSIEGPGLLSADLRASSNTFVHLSDCWLFNKSTIPVEKANIKYVFGRKAYLNFTELDEPSPWLWHSIIENYDAAFNLIRFKGPKNFREFKAENDRISSSPGSILMRGP